MNRIPPWFTPHQIIIRPFLGVGGGGEIHGDPSEPIPAFVEDIREVVTDSEGQEVVANTRIHLNFDDAPAERSLVTTWPGNEFSREAPVVRVARQEHPALFGYAVVHLR